MPVFRVVKVFPVHKETKGRRVGREAVFKGLKGIRGRKAFRVHKVVWGRRANRVIKAISVRKVHRACRGRRVRAYKARRAPIPARRVHRDHKGFRAIPAFKGLLAPLDRKELLDPPVPLVHKVHRVLLAVKVCRGRQGSRGLRAGREYLVITVLRVFRDHRVRIRGRKAVRVLRARQVPMDFRAARVTRDRSRRVACSV